LICNFTAGIAKLSRTRDWEFPSEISAATYSGGNNGWSNARASARRVGERCKGRSTGKRGQSYGGNKEKDPPGAIMNLK